MTSDLAGAVLVLYLFHLVRPLRHPAIQSRLAGTVLAVALMAVLGWPALATVLEAGRVQASLEVGRGDAEVVRPIRLAFETVRLVLATEAIAFPIGLPLALVLFRTDVWGRRAVLGLIALAAFVPLPLHATAWLGAFGNVGRAQAIGRAPILEGWAGAAFVHAMAAVPWAVVLAGVGLRAVEPELEESALLDLPAARVLARVTVRRAAGALAGAALAVAVLTAGDMTVTDLLQIRTYAEESYLQYSLGHGPGSAAAVALPPLAVLGVLVVVTARGLLRADPARIASAAAGGRVWRLGRWRVPLGAAIVATAGNLVALPLYGLIWRAGRVGGAAALGRPPHWSLSGLCGTLGSAAAEVASPLAQSAAWASGAATAAVALAWPLAWVSRRAGPWRWAVAAIVALALATPGPVAGMALVLGYGDVPLVYDSAVMLALAGVLRALPFVLLVLWPAVRAVPPELLDAAALDGYGAWGQVAAVALPLTRGAAIAAWGVAFVLALGELPATILVAPPGVTPLSVVIWSLLHTGVESHLAGVALIMLAAVAVAGLLAVWALGQVAHRP
jgi:iron(III) transport system permease protein